MANGPLSQAVIPALHGSNPNLRSRMTSVSLFAAPILLGGFFLFIAISSYVPLASRPVALPGAGKADLLLDDFVVFYAAGKHVSDVNGDIYEPSAISALEANETGQQTDRVAILPFFNPPAALLPFFLLGLLPLGLAAAVWLPAGVTLAFASFGTLRLSRVSLASETGLLFALGVASSLPLYQALIHGQMTFILLAGFCFYGAGILRPGRGGYAVAGLLLLALKPVFLPLPLLYLAVTGRHRIILQFAAVEVALVLLAALLFGPKLPVDYARMSIDALGWDEVNGISTYGMFGWTGFWRGLLGPGSHATQVLLTSTFALTTVAAFAYIFRRGDQPRLALAAMVLSALLISPHSYAQDLLLVTLPILLLAEEYPNSRAPYAIAAIAWLAAFVHFDTLAMTGVGAANFAVVLLTAGVFAQGVKLRVPRPATRPVQIPRPAPMDVVFTSADAAGS